MVSIESNRVQPRSMSSVRETAETPTEERRAVRPARRVADTLGRTSLVVSAATAASLAATGAAIVGILGLCGVAGATMRPIAVLVLAPALLLLSAIGGQWARIARASFTSEEALTFWVGTLLMAVTAVGGIVLGLLSLLLPLAALLTGIAATVFGVTLLGSGVVLEAVGRSEKTRIIAWQSDFLPRLLLSLTIAYQYLAGTASIVLGVLALCGLSPLVLTLVAMLIVADASICAATALCLVTLRVAAERCLKA